MLSDANTCQPQSIQLTVNGRRYEFQVGEHPGQVQSQHTLAETLRNTLGLTGTKIACDHGACGCCTVILDSRAVLSCTTLTIECNGKSVTTVEGLEDPHGKLDPLQQAFIDNTAFQCGFCTPGILMTSKALLMQNPSPTTDQVKQALGGNFCRCISHYHVLDAVVAAGSKG